MRKDSLDKSTHDSGPASSGSLNDTRERVFIETVANGLVGSVRQGVASLEGRVLGRRTFTLGDRDGRLSGSVRGRGDVAQPGGKSVKVVGSLDATKHKPFSLGLLYERTIMKSRPCSTHV